MHRKDMQMTQTIEDAGKYGKEFLDTGLETFGNTCAISQPPLRGVWSQQLMRSAVTTGLRIMRPRASHLLHMAGNQVTASLGAQALYNSDPVGASGWSKRLCPPSGLVAGLVAGYL